MKDDFKELIEYLDEKFLKVDDRFERVDQQFLNIENRFERVDQRFDEIRGDFSDLQTSVDAYMKQGEDYRQEMLMLSHKVARHEKWIIQIAEKLGIKLEV